MPLLSPAFSLLATLPVSVNIFVTVIVVSACVYGTLVVFNYLSLKYKSTNRFSVASVIILAAGLLSSEATFALTFNGDAPPLLKTLPGQLSAGLLVIAAGVALFAFIHCLVHRHHYRRGRKRALGTFVFSLLALGALYSLSNSSKTPRVSAAPRSRVELIRETDPYGRPLATPEAGMPAPAAPVPATPPREAALPVPLGTPVRIATPTPARLLPSVITPN